MAVGATETTRPSCVNARAETPSGWPGRVSRIAPVRASISAIVPSGAAAATVAPSRRAEVGEREAAGTGGEVPDRDPAVERLERGGARIGGDIDPERERLADREAAARGAGRDVEDEQDVCVEEPDRAIAIDETGVAAGRQARIDAAQVGREPCDLRARAHVVNPDLGVEPQRQPGAVGRERQGAVERVDRDLAVDRSVGEPHEDDPLRSTRERRSPSGAIARASRVGRNGDPGERATGDQVPRDDLMVAAAGDQVLAVAGRGDREDLAVVPGAAAQRPVSRSQTRMTSSGSPVTTTPSAAKAIASTPRNDACSRSGVSSFGPGVPSARHSRASVRPPAAIHAPSDDPPPRRDSAPAESVARHARRAPRQ